MKKLFLIVLFMASAAIASAAHPGPAQWSLAGVASWAQILTASGTAIPTATTTYTIGDLYARYTPASTTMELYRLNASGSTSVWVPFQGGTGGGVDPAALDAVSASLTAHLNDIIDPHSAVQEIGDTGFFNYSDSNGITRKYDTIASAPLDGFEVVVASFSMTTEPYFYVIPAPASSTRFLGIAYSDYGGKMYVLEMGYATVDVETTSTAIVSGDWVITSDSEPGTVERASVAGDQPLPFDEFQRRVGIAIYDEYAGTVDVLLKGNK